MEGIALVIFLGGLFVLDRWLTIHRKAGMRDSAEAGLRGEVRKRADAEFDLSRRLTDLRKYVRLSSQLWSDRAQQVPVSQHPEATERPIDYAKRCILLAFPRLGMEIPVVKVRFASLGGAHAGCVQQERDGSWAVDIDKSVENDLDAVLSVVGHEIAHVALNSRRIHLDPEQANEELTDTAAVLAGFGPVMLKTVLREEVSETQDRLLIQAHTLGYLPPRALAYLTAFSVELAGGDAQFFLEHVPEWQRESVAQYVVLRDEWQVRASRSRGEKLECFGCGTLLLMPTVKVAIRVRCSVCRYRHYVPESAAS